MGNSSAFVKDSLFIETFERADHNFVCEGINVKVEQNLYKISQNISKIELNFTVEKPVRFNLQVMIPDNVINACAVLNNQVLIMPMNVEWPESEYPLRLSECQQRGESVSTLKPGNYQHISFCWQSGDILEIIMVF